jgi:exosortase/archaeosortase family protein
MAQLQLNTSGRVDAFAEDGAASSRKGAALKQREAGQPNGCGETACMLSAVLAAVGAWGLISWPGVEREIFCHAAAWLAGLLSGSPVLAVGDGWELVSPITAVVTVACSGTTYYVMVAALIGWHLGKGYCRVWGRAIVAVVCALPAALVINAVRIVVVMQAHCWVIPHFPKTYSPFLHMLTGMTVFLPAFIALNIFLETYGRTHTHADS